MSTLVLRPNARILFIGDSITDAFRKPEEINDAYQMGNGYAFLIASKLRGERPRDNYQFFNRGVSGEGVLQLAARWDEDCLRLEPDVVSVLVGINDTIQRDHNTEGTFLSPNEFGTAFASLLHRTRAALPEVRLVLCEPFLLPCGMATPEAQVDVGARADVVRSLALKFNATAVSLQSVFETAQRHAPPEYWAYDGIHPTAAGHHLLAKAWLDAVAVK